MAVIVITPKARKDITRCHAFLIEHTADTALANRAIKTIRDKIGLLKTAPSMGKIHYVDKNTRELSICFGQSGYFALYQYDTRIDVVTIIGVRHMREQKYR